MTDSPPAGAPHNLTLRLVPSNLAVCYLPADSPLPEWATRSAFFSVTRTGQELSIVCDHDAIPPRVQHEGPWRCLEVEGPLDFALTGILARLAVPLAQARISIFAISTYRTDYLLVPAEKLLPALDTLRAAGHRIDGDQPNQRQSTP